MDDRKRQVRAHISQLLVNEMIGRDESIQRLERNVLADRIILKGRAAMQALPSYVLDDDDVAFRLNTEEHMSACKADISIARLTKEIFGELLAYLQREEAD